MSGRGYRDSKDRWRAERRAGDTPSVTRMLDRLEADVREGRRWAPTDEVLDRLCDQALRDDGMASDAQLRRLQVLASKCGLARAERLELADVMLRRSEPVTTWKGLTTAEARTLSDALEGFAFIAHLQAEQGRRWRYGSCSAQPCPMRGDPEASAAALLRGPAKEA